MDTSQDFAPSQGGVVQWVASQSPNPALQALMKEAERDKRSRPCAPVHEPTSWTYPLASVTRSTATSPQWHSGDTLSGSTSFASSSSLGPRASEHSVSRRVKPLSDAQWKPLASSTSSANQPPRHLARPRSSSQSHPSTPKEKYTPQDDEPEAILFIELLKKTSRQVDVNAMMKEQAARGEKREQSLGRCGSNNRVGSDKINPSARPLTKTSSASAVYHSDLSTKPQERPPSASTLAHRPEHAERGRISEKTLSSSASSSDRRSGKSTPVSLPSPNLNCNPKPVPTSCLSAKASSVSDVDRANACKAVFLEPPSHDGDATMQDVTDLPETDTEWETPISDPISRADTAMCINLDDESSDTEMDTSFFKPELPLQACVPAPKPKPQSSQSTRPPITAQRNRTGPPPLGMRRAPQLQPSQYSSTQGTKGVTAPRFKPPLLANAGGMTSKNGSGTWPTTTAISSRAPLRGGARKAAAVVEIPARTNQDPDSSFDVSFDVDADALEEAMKAYD